MPKLIISCEHGGNEIPKAYRHLFIKHLALLQTHRAYDIGALALAKTLSPLADYTQTATISRLLVELNRSLHHPKLFSEMSKSLSAEDKQIIINKYYRPYRDKLEQTIQKCINSGHRVVHISVHSFTPELNGEIRNADIGFLYDPARKIEKAFCASWHKNLKAAAPDLRLRCNYPYAGKADGLTTHLRKQFNEQDYQGIELETNQGLWQRSRNDQLNLQQVIATTLSNTYRSGIV